MANPDDVEVRNTFRRDSQEEALKEQVNNLTASMRLLTAKLDADAGVTDTNYAALITDSAIATAPALVVNP